MAAAGICSALLFTAPDDARAQVFIDATGGAGAVCREAGGQLVYVPSGEDCDEDYISIPVSEFTIGPDESYIDLDPATGNATFGGSATFNGATSFAQGTTFGGAVSAAGLTSTSGMSNTGTFSNTGSGTFTGSLTAGSISSGGSGTFTGALSASGLTTTGTVSAGSLFSTGATTVQGYFSAQNGANLLGTTQLATVQVFQSLSVQSGATVTMNGNRIQNVGAPTAGTDAVNKNYVDALAGSAQVTADAALANAATAQETAELAQDTADTARVEAAAAQATADTGLARTRALGAGTAAAMGGGATYNATTATLSAPSYSIAGESYADIGSAFTAVDDQLQLLDTRLGALSDATDRGFRHANGGIATALALGGTMIVPDSAVSVSFNLATYRGEQGFSGALVVQAAPKVYISGGFAGSTVKGSTGGRVGIAFGL
jgi:hypothetical protein